MRRPEPPLAALAGAGLVGTGLGVWGAKHLHFDTGDRALCGMGALEGMYYGGFLVDMLAPRRNAGGGVLLGGKIGRAHV